MEVVITTAGSTARAPDRDPSWEAIVDRLSAVVDWDSALPPSAFGSSWRIQQRIKRAFDVIVSAVALVIVLPFLALIALLVALDGGSVFYRWRVVGYRGRLFTGYKFRTMVGNADQLKDQLASLNEMSGPVFKIKNDPRVTRIGRFLRRHSLDELPQLWSVLRGDMSLVGPRPLSAREFAGAEDWQRLKLSVRPGLTCLWQVSGRSHISDFAEWVRLDLQYIREWNLWRDLGLLVRTLWVVIRGSGGY
jgi:lipopolysaccharide/colanic/teichoic acid biosynthesis glycosyltransferase